MITDYHAKLFAHELSKRHSVADAEKLASTLLDAQVDLNPHQVEAALFAFKTPLSKLDFVHFSQCEAKLIGNDNPYALQTERMTCFLYRSPSPVLLASLPPSFPDRCGNTSKSS